MYTETHNGEIYTAEQAPVKIYGDHTVIVKKNGNFIFYVGTKRIDDAISIARIAERDQDEAFEAFERSHPELNP